MHVLVYSVALESFHNWVSLQTLIQFSGSVETVSLVAVFAAVVSRQRKVTAGSLMNSSVY